MAYSTTNTTMTCDSIRAKEPAPSCHISCHSSKRHKRPRLGFNTKHGDEGQLVIRNHSMD